MTRIPFVIPTYKPQELYTIFSTCFISPRSAKAGSKDQKIRETNHPIAIESRGYNFTELFGLDHFVIVELYIFKQSELRFARPFPSLYCGRRPQATNPDGLLPFPQTQYMFAVFCLACIGREGNPIHRRLSDHAPWRLVFVYCGIMDIVALWT